jgi:hypothetical protein
MASTVKDERLSVYLSDHLAGSEAAIRLIKRYLDREPDSELGRVLDDLIGRILEDRAELQALMTRIGASPSLVKKAGAIGAELLANLRGRAPVLGAGSDEVARLEDLELLSMGIEGKRLLWRALESCEHPALEGMDLAGLAERAQGQRDHLEPFRRRAAAAAFG